MTTSRTVPAYLVPNRGFDDFVYVCMPMRPYTLKAIIVLGRDVKSAGRSIAMGLQKFVALRPQRMDFWDFYRWWNSPYSPRQVKVSHWYRTTYGL